MPKTGLHPIKFWLTTSGFNLTYPVRKQDIVQESSGPLPDNASLISLMVSVDVKHHVYLLTMLPSRSGSNPECLLRPVNRVDDDYRYVPVAVLPS